MNLSKIKLFVLTIFGLVILLSCSRHKAIESKEGRISDDSLFTLVQYKTFQYFWDGAEPISGEARERYHVDEDYPDNRIG